MTACRGGDQNEHQTHFHTGIILKPVCERCIRVSRMCENPNEHEGYKGFQSIALVLMPLRVLGCRNLQKNCVCTEVFGSAEMDASRFVWLPSSGVWACLLSSSSGAASTSSSGIATDNNDAGDDYGRAEHFDVGGRERGKVKFRKRNRSVDEGAERHRDPEVVQNSLGFRVERQRHYAVGDGELPESGEEADCEGTFSSQQSLCAICLGTIEEGREAVLQWCMHRFCTHCIEEWSRVRRVCPLCKAEVRGWFHNIGMDGEFEERLLVPVVKNGDARLPRHDGFYENFRVHLWRQRFLRNQARTRRRPLQGRPPAIAQGIPLETRAFRRLVPFPTQRSFDVHRRPRGARITRIDEEEAAARARQWRASIYRKGLKACPFQIQKRSSSTQLYNPDAKARAERRLGPWIHRELQVLLRDPNPDLLVHLVLVLWFATEHELSKVSQQPSTNRRRSRDVSLSGRAEEEAIKELERYLGVKARMFWHELRCFVESPFTMKAYDTIVVYNRGNLPESSNQIEGSSRQEMSGEATSRADEATSRAANRPSEPGRDCQRSSDGHGQYLSARKSLITQTQNLFSERLQGSLCLPDNLRRPLIVTVRDSNFNHSKKRQRLDTVPGQNDRWQMCCC